MKKRMRKGISMFILMSFIFSMFVENLVLATVLPMPEEGAISSELIEEDAVIESSAGIPKVTITNSANEITRNEQISYTASIEGLTEEVSYLDITYSLAGDEANSIHTSSRNWGGNLSGSIQAYNHTYPGLYEIDYVDVYTETSNYRVYNEKYHPNEGLIQS
ncbi:MAG: hypothetical protein EOM18_09600, partial [Clostridia bacterium]|nr:hypothetical protein [Clostridia bacterium]